MYLPTLTVNYCICSKTGAIKAIMRTAPRHQKNHAKPNVRLPARKPFGTVYLMRQRYIPKPPKWIDERPVAKLSINTNNRIDSKEVFK